MIDSTDYRAVERAVFEVVSNATRYPVDSLDGGLSFDADLGIDADTWLKLRNDLRAVFPHLAARNTDQPDALKDVVEWCFTGSVGDRPNDEGGGSDGDERPERTRLLDTSPGNPATSVSDSGRHERRDARTISEPGDAATDRSPRIRLVGINEECGDRVWTFGEPFQVGRMPGGLSLDATSVSRLHALVSRDECGWWVTDWKSTNGTYLNGARIGEEPAGPLQAGDTLQFAKCAFRVDFACEPATLLTGSGEAEEREIGWAGSKLMCEALVAAVSPRREYVLAKCGCARRFAHLLRPEHLATIERSERTAEGVESPQLPEAGEADPLTALVNGLTFRLPEQFGFEALLSWGGNIQFIEWLEADWSTGTLAEWLSLAGDRPEERAAEEEAQGHIVRDVFGDPQRPVVFDARWRTTEVISLATVMYETGDFCAMPILADALQDAGCDSDAVLDHCRGNTPHVRGCWVVDGVLGHRSQEARVRQLGLADPLTGVGSGRACSAVVRRSILEGVALLALEIDSFAPFAETHSARVGDRAVVAIARLLRDALGHWGFLARTADAEFRIVLPNSARTVLLGVGERLRRAVAGWRWSNNENGSEYTFTISVGAATAGEAAITRNSDSEARRLRAELEADAVSALRRAQACGGNRVCLTKRGGTGE